MGDKIMAVVGSIVIVAFATTLVLPGRQTPALAKAIGDAFSNSLKAATGQAG